MRAVISVNGREAEIDTDKIGEGLTHLFDETSEAVRSLPTRIVELKRAFIDKLPWDGTIDETDDFRIDARDTIEEARLKYHARHWKKQAENWRAHFLRNI
jgi:hypothetical protein